MHTECKRHEIRETRVFMSSKLYHTKRSYLSNIAHGKGKGKGKIARSKKGTLGRQATGGEMLGSILQSLLSIVGPCGSFCVKEKSSSLCVKAIASF